MATTIAPKTDEAVAAAPPEPAVPFAGTPPQPASPAPARSRGVRRLVVFVGKRRHRDHP